MFFQVNPPHYLSSWGSKDHRGSHVGSAGVHKNSATCIALMNSLALLHYDCNSLYLPVANAIKPQENDLEDKHLHQVSYLIRYLMVRMRWRVPEHPPTNRGCSGPPSVLYSLTRYFFVELKWHFSFPCWLDCVHW